MKKCLYVFFFALISVNNIFGQWYVKKYQVSDINSLTKTQLEESLEKSKSDLFISGGIAGLGGVMIVIFKYLKPGMSDDPSFIEELIGDEGINKIGMAFGFGFLAGGTVAGIVYIGRIGSIKSAMRRNYPYNGSLSISPDLILNRYSRIASPGIRLTYSF
jgi:hypothetical protein